MLQNAGFKDIMFEARSWWSSLELTNEQFFNLFSAYGMFSVRIAPYTVGSPLQEPSKKPGRLLRH
jgi:hypothetical protein